MASYWWTPMIRTAHPVHASNRAHSSLRGIDDDMPQGGFRYLDGADITHLDPVLPAELRPSQPWNMVAATLIRGDTRLSRPCRARRCLERDCARFQDPNRLTEDRWQILQVQSHWSTNATDLCKLVSMHDSEWSTCMTVHIYIWQMACNSQYYGKMSNSMY